EGQQAAGNGRVQHELPFAQLAEQVLAGVGHRLQVDVAQEAARALDGVDGAENARQPFAMLRLGLQRDEVAVELIEVFVTLDEKLLDDVVQLGHAPRPPSRNEESNDFNSGLTRNVARKI